MNENTSKNSKDKSSGEKNTNKSAAIVVLWIVAISAVIITCTFVYANLFFIIPQNSDDKYIKELLSAALAIIGLVVSVWTGLNIVNAIERKDFEKLKDDISDLTNKSISLKSEIEDTRKNAEPVLKILEDIKEKQLSSDKVKLLNEMYNTVQDISTRVLIEKIRDIEDTSNIDFLEILEVERRFSNVYNLHISEYSYDEGLLNEANEGILLSKKILERDNINYVIKQYLNYRIAEFSFYSGYCCSHADRENFFIDAITIYQSVYCFFDAQLPVFEVDQEFPNINYKECKNNNAKISAYFCNSIGEAYSKIIQIKNRIFASDSKLEEYGMKAIFYCAYASKWDEKETYLRNLGCAIERHYGISKETYDTLNEVYKKAITNAATQNAFKVLLSASDKFINYYLNIKDVNITNGREIPLGDDSYIQNWNNLEQDIKDKILNILKSIYENANYAKTIYPAKEVGYVYNCIYHRDMCLINRNNKDRANQHILDAKKDLNILKVINPEGKLTKILDADLASLSQN